MINIGNNLNFIYEKLLETYSYQGWWPFLDHEGVNPTKSGSVNGYHPEDYDFPKNIHQKFEVIFGSILTQNTAWPSVEQALNNLNNLIEFTPESLLNFANNNENEFKDAIRCAGFVNQKANYLKNISEFYISIGNEVPSRKTLLNVKGIGNETADSILLFAHKEKQFKVDAYTKRIFTYLGYITEKDSYMSVKNLFEANFKGNVNMFQEYHALIVEHAKRYYSKKPFGVNDKILIEFKI
ncbi:endonuclease III domain-containing protein [Methanobrevibacter sp. TMH8]|uniref:endonuclease III domain-containing protein n=1 Tax=Methanobrevibacter sp. TMH8 TaxID=2848611 RepID=UPI001CCC06BB|nr:endonuclease III domain-containing protein [Methanobrevibacter sp. TMH8]MBZ9571275.1 endonuclease III domain-containing protein [Methanobrevibacter sp. TMH8]